MKKSINRRELIKRLGLSGMALGLAPATLQDLFGESGSMHHAIIQEPDETMLDERLGDNNRILESNKIEANRSGTEFINGKAVAPRRELPIFKETDVLVLGGGPSGAVAAIAAARTGAKVMLVERFGHFGGLWTGGIVPLVTGHIVADSKNVCQGIGEEIMNRLDKIHQGIMDRGPGETPTSDTEHTKYILLNMIMEAGVDVLLHSRAVDSIMEGNTVRGAVFESKAGRQAILAKVVVDCTGDGDIWAAAGASYEHRLHHIGLGIKMGGMDTIRPIPTDRELLEMRLGGPYPVDGVTWIGLVGPPLDAIDIEDITTAEIKAREFIWKFIEKKRKEPGFESIYIMETSPQIGVRISRILDGVETVTRADMEAGKQQPNVIGVGGAGRRYGGAQIPLGALIPRKIENILTAGRCISMDMDMQSLRLIPNCFVTGHGAGVAAAVASMDSTTPREVNIDKVQKILRQQKAYLG